MPVPKGWPADGKIDLKDVFVKYGTDPPVLRGISATIMPKEKVSKSEDGHHFQDYLKKRHLNLDILYFG